MVGERTKLTGGAGAAIRGRIWHLICIAVLMLGIFFHFLLVDCIPRSKALDDLPDNAHDKYRKGLYMATVGSGIVEGCALLLLFLVLYGVHKSRILKYTGYFLLVVYTLGALLNMIGVGIMTHEMWPHRTDSAYRSTQVGVLMGDACIATAGLLIVLPEFGLF